MSENNTNGNKPAKVFVNGIWVREKVFADGGSLLNLAILPERFIESLKAVKPDESGFIRLVIQKRLNPDEKSTHTMSVDTFVKTVAKQPAAKTPVSPKKSAPAPAENDDSSF